MIATGGFGTRDHHGLHALETELAHAQVVPDDEVPPDVITMNSRAELVDLDTGERMAFTVVFPAEANVDEGRISVLAPVGAGMLGYRVGEIFRRSAPDGVRRLKVARIHFQPEAALATVA
jgi:regulator of nucleoside diphosphate kinase